MPLMGTPGTARCNPVLSCGAVSVAAPVVPRVSPAVLTVLRETPLRSTLNVPSFVR
jgi:hypothetical protein